MARAKDNDKPAQIIDAAFSVFGQIGYASAVMKDIADRAGVAPGTIYTYFHDKEDLFKATVIEGWDGFLDKIRSIVESDAPVTERTGRLLAAGFDSLKRYLPLLRGMLFESSQMNLMQGKIGEFCGLVERLMERSPPRTPQPAADLAQRRTLIRITVMGVLFSAALTETSGVDARIDELRRAITMLLSGASR
jgi:AcrR family transcriptional regulator